MEIPGCRCVGVDCSSLDDACNDGMCNPTDGSCYAEPKADSTPCEDGDFCTSETGTPATPDHCEAGVCVGIPVDCGDGDQCNDDVCIDATGACDAIPKADSTPCEDGSFCTSETGAPQTPDHCESGACVGVPVDCDDGDVCTLDSCDQTGVCINEQIPGCGVSLCNPDGDDDVDRDDIYDILANRNRPVDTTNPYDIARDSNNDGYINSSDAKVCIQQCTRPRCATQ